MKCIIVSDKLNKYLEGDETMTEETREQKMARIAREALTPELARALLTNNLRERELNSAFMNGYRVIDLILAGVLVRTNNGIRTTKEAVPILMELK